MGSVAGAPIGAVPGKVKMGRGVHKPVMARRPARHLPSTIGWCVGFMLLFPAHLFGLTNDITNDPAKVLEKYLSLDKRGARLTALSYEVLKPYTAWGEEPVWGQVVVISRYAVAQDVNTWEIVSPVEAVIPVFFDVLGVIQWEAATFLTEVREEVIHVRIKAVDNRWKIVSPQFPPHVGQKRLIDFVRDVQVNESLERRKEILGFLRQALEQAG